MENRDKLYNDMKKSEDYVQRINPRHLTPPLAFEELKNMTGDTGVDGNFLVFFIIVIIVFFSGPHFIEWLSCLITEKDFLSPPANAPKLNLVINSKKFSSVKDQINRSCRKKQNTRSPNLQAPCDPSIEGR
jgi:hypothetical protein